MSLRTPYFLDFDLILDGASRFLRLEAMNVKQDGLCIAGRSGGTNGRSQENVLVCPLKSDLTCLNPLE